MFTNVKQRATLDSVFLSHVELTTARISQLVTLEAVTLRTRWEHPLIFKHASGHYLLTLTLAPNFQVFFFSHWLINLKALRSRQKGLG